MIRLGLWFLQERSYDTNINSMYSQCEIWCPHWPWSLGKHSVCQLLHRKATLFLSFFFFKSFLIWIIFKVFTEFVTILLLFYVLVFGPWGTWDLSFPRDGTSTPSIGRWSPNHWTARDVPKLLFSPLPPAFPSSGLLKEARTHGPHIRDGELCPTPGRVSVQQEWFRILLHGALLSSLSLSYSIFYFYQYEAGVFILCCCCVVTLSFPALLLPRGLELIRLLCPWGFSRQKYWSGLPCPPPGDLPHPGINFHLLHLLHCRWILYHCATREAHLFYTLVYNPMSLNCVVQIGPALAVVGALSSSLWAFDKLLSTPVPGCLITFYFLALQDALFLSCHPHSWLFLVLFSILFSPEIK